MTHTHNGATYEFQPPLNSSEAALKDALVEHFLVEQGFEKGHLMAKFIGEQIDTNLEVTRGVSNDPDIIAHGLGTLTTRDVKVVR